MKFMRAFNEQRNPDKLYCLKMTCCDLNLRNNDFTNDLYKEFDLKQKNLVLIQK